MSDWKEYSLGNLVELVIDYRGKTPLKLGGNWSFSGYRALSAKNIKTGQIVNEESIRFVDEDLYRKWMKDEVQRGDILITSEAPFGQILFWDSDEKIVLSQRLFCLRISSRACPRFVYYYMTTHTFQHELDGRATGTTVIGLRQPELLKCRIKLPTYKEQVHIADILKSIDDKIECNRQINKNLEQQAQALFKSWFVDFEPFKDQPFVESELGMIPQGWIVETLGNLLDIKYGKDHKKLSDGEIPVYGSGGLMRYAEKALYSGESVLIPRKGSLNNVMYVNEAFWTVDTMFYSIPKVSDVMLYSYIYLSNRDLSSLNAGSAVPSMTTEILNSMKVVFPDNIVLKDFNKKAQTLYKSLKLYEQESRRLAELRDTLLPKLMSGGGINVNDCLI